MNEVDMLNSIRAMISVSAIADALDTIDRRHQCLGWDIVPMTTTPRLVGRAYTVRTRSFSAPQTDKYDKYVGLLRALDSLGSDQVWVMATSRSDEVAVWGELVSTAAQAVGATGMVTDGLVRDLRQIRALGFPTFARGSIPHDIDGRLEVAGVEEGVEIDGVSIGFGDLIVADEDGVVVVPKSVESDVIEAALEKVTAENLFRVAVAQGTKPSVAFEKYGVL